MSVRAPAAAVVSRDLRSVRLEQVLRAKWKDEVRARPPAERLRWLASQEGIVALGARQCAQLLKELHGRRERMSRTACSDAWLDAWENHNDPARASAACPLGRGDLAYPPQQPDLPPSDREDTTRDRRYRRYAVRMLLSRARTRVGMAGTPSRRWTPPNAVDLEDYLDGMDERQAHRDWETHHSSCSAVVIQLIGAYKATPIDGNW